MIVLWLCFAAAPPVTADVSTGPIVDNLGVFSPAAVAEAKQRIAQIREQFGYELWIETVADQPSMSDISGLLYKSVREDRLRMWIRDRIRETSLVKGLYVVISRQPPDVRMAAWPTEAEQRLTWARREEVRIGMRRYLRNAEYDRALIEAIDRFEALLAATAEPASPLATVPLIIIMGAMCGFWLVLCLVRRRVLHQDQPMYPASVQGTIFGLPAVTGIYDRLERLETK